MSVHAHVHTYTIARIKRNVSHPKGVIPDPYGVRYTNPEGVCVYHTLWVWYHPEGVVREPGSRRLTVRYVKEKRPLTGPRRGPV